MPDDGSVGRWAVHSDWRGAYHSQDFFARHLGETATTLDPRDDAQLADDGLSAADPAIREHALVELTARRGEGAWTTLVGAYQQEPDPDVRVTLLDELALIDQERLRREVSPLSGSGLEESWWRAHGEQTPGVERAAKSDPEEPFDQVIRLRIRLMCFVQLGETWARWALSPLVVRRVAGQLYACSTPETRHARIAVTKQLDGHHADGSLHLENVLFRGRTVMMEDRTGVFNFEAHVDAPLYPSGRLGDRSEGMLRTPLHVVRAGGWKLASDVTIRDLPAIDVVTGLIRGWGYANPQHVRFDADGRFVMTTGIFNLAGITDAASDELVNVYIAGGYRGFLADDDGDGLLDLNTSASYMTLDGEIDRDRDGVADEPGEHFDVCTEIVPA